MPQTNEKRSELYWQNREKILEAQRQYLRDHPEKSKEYNRRSYWGHVEARRSARTSYYQANKDAEIKRNRAYQEANKEDIRLQRRGHYLENRDRIIGAVAERYEANRFSVQHAKQRMLVRTRYRAKKFGIPFNLSLGDIEIPDVCPVLGTPFDFTSNNGLPRPTAPSVDKIIPSLGYVKGNVMVISHRANYLKGNASLEEMEKLVEFMRKINNKTTSS